MEREEWMVDGKMGFKTYCPVSEKAEAASRGKRKAVAISVADRDARSVLETHFDEELHQMTGYMRRLDGFFSSIWGSIMQVISEVRLDALLKAEVMM